MTPTRIRVGKYYWGMGASLITLLGGGWLVLAPFALGYQAGNTGGWTDMTQNDVWAGIGVVLLSAAGLALFARALVAELRSAGVVRERPRRQAHVQPVAPAPAAAEAAAPVAPSTGFAPASRPDLEQTMATLAAALAADLTERRKGDAKVDDEHVAGPATLRRDQ
jgi:hypothetical protein